MRSAARYTVRCSRHARPRRERSGQGTAASPTLEIIPAGFVDPRRGWVLRPCPARPKRCCTHVSPSKAAIAIAQIAIVGIRMVSPMPIFRAGFHTGSAHRAHSADAGPAHSIRRTPLHLRRSPTPASKPRHIVKPGDLRSMRTAKRRSCQHRSKTCRRPPRGTLPSTAHRRRTRCAPAAPLPRETGLSAPGRRRDARCASRSSSSISASSAERRTLPEAKPSVMSSEELCMSSSFLRLHSQRRANRRSPAGSSCRSLPADACGPRRSVRRTWPCDCSPTCPSSPSAAPAAPGETAPG